MREKFKSFLADDSLYLASLLVGVGILAFALGRLSVVTDKQQNLAAVNQLSLCPTTLCQAPLPSPVPAVQGQAISVGDTSSESSQYVASKAGSKYHHLTCPGAKQIKEENKIYFDTTQEAQAAGYTKAANCDR